MRDGRGVSVGVSVGVKCVVERGGCFFKGREVLQ